MAGLPLDLSKYYQSPFGLLGQMGQVGATPSFVDDGQNDVSNQEDLADEYEGQAGYYPPGMVSQSATVAAGPRQKTAAELRSQQDYDLLRAAIGQAPKEAAPKWWQRAAGAAAGFGAGWSNAAGRSRAPIDIGAMRENILHPGYQQKLQEWQSRVGPLQQIAGLDQAQTEQERRSRQLDIQEDWNKARAEGEHQRGLMWAARARAYDAGKIGGKAGGAPSTADLLNNISEIEKGLGRKLDPNEVEYYLLNRGAMSGYGTTLANPNAGGSNLQSVAPGAAVIDKNTHQLVYQNPKEFDPGVQASRELSQELTRQRIAENDQRMAAGVEKSKADVFDKVRKEREGLVRALLSHYPMVASEGQLRTLKNPKLRAEASAALTQINQSLAPRLQSALDEYARAVRARGGTAEDWVVDPSTLAHSIRKPK